MIKGKGNIFDFCSDAGACAGDATLLWRHHPEFCAIVPPAAVREKSCCSGVTDAPYHKCGRFGQRATFHRLQRVAMMSPPIFVNVTFRRCKDWKKHCMGQSGV